MSKTVYKVSWVEENEFGHSVKRARRFSTREAAEALKGDLEMDDVVLGWPQVTVEKGEMV